MGDAEVTVEAQANGLDAPGSFGSQFETYVVWAIYRQERRSNWAQWKRRGSVFELNTKSTVRSFAIVVTADPYLQVTRPADMIVLEVPAGAQTVAANCEFLMGGYTPVGYRFQPIDTGAGYLCKLCKCTMARRIAMLAGAQGSDNFQMGDEWFNSVVVSVKPQKKFSDVILHQAVSATEYFEAARVKALEPLMQ
jgi:hypothetical protein